MNNEEKPMRQRKLGLYSALFISVGLLFQGCQSTTSTPEVKMDVSKEKASVSPSQSEQAVSAADSKNTGAKVFKNGGPFKVYSDGSAPDNHYVASGWMGDYGDVKLDDKCLINPHSGTTSVKIIYNGKATQGARWVGMYWQNPPNNWGTRPGGYDLTGAKKVTFWARGEKGGERIEEFKIGGITGEYADSDVAGIGPVVLTTEWQEFTIDLEGKDLSSISGGFCWSTNLDVNPEGCTFYLDDIKYE
jgi:hypothetical protein